MTRQTAGLLDGFRILHEQLPERAVCHHGHQQASEFPLYLIVAVVLINLVGVVIQPHFITTGGGSAKTETRRPDRGSWWAIFLKRLCTVGWALTALIALALYADAARTGAQTPTRPGASLRGSCSAPGSPD